MEVSGNSLILHGNLAQKRMGCQGKSRGKPLFFKKLSPEDFLRSHHQCPFFPARGAKKDSIIRGLSMPNPTPKVKNSNLPPRHADPAYTSKGSLINNWHDQS